MVLGPGVAGSELQFAGEVAATWPNVTAAARAAGALTAATATDGLSACAPGVARNRPVETRHAAVMARWVRTR